MLTKALLFSFQGRVGRKTFWIWNVVYYVLIAVFSVGISQLLPTLSYLLLPIFLLILLVPDLAITAKRWHDRDKSSYWLALNIPLILGRLGTPLASPVSGDTSTPLMLIASVSLICGVWILVECGFLKGTAGPNQYGAEPV